MAKECQLPVDARHKSDLQHSLLRFLADRAERRFYANCPMDGCTLPTLAERTLGGAPARVTWCRWCGLGFVHRFDPRYAWELAGSFVFDKLTPRYVVEKKWIERGVQKFATDVAELQEILSGVAVPPPA